MSSGPRRAQGDSVRPKLSPLWLLLVVGAALALVVLALAPEIDLYVAGLFHRPLGFVATGPLARFGRNVFRIAPFVFLAVSALFYLARRFGVWAPCAPSGRGVLFLALTMAVGPGLIVNLALKDHTHRPRPVHVEEFGGTLTFRPWESVDGGCDKNCSFASGEASSGFWMIAPALLTPPPIRGVALALALAFGAAASLLRMAAGAHFLSDVIAGGLVSIVVVLATRRALWPRDGL